MDSTQLVWSVMMAVGQNDAKDLRSRSTDMTSTEIIREETKIPDFDPKHDYSDWPMGAPVQDEGQVWILLQPHNASFYEGRPSTLRALWGLAHTKDPSRAKPFVEPYGTSGMYMEGECVNEGGVVYRCLQDNVVYSPYVLPDVWEQVLFEPLNPMP